MIAACAPTLAPRGTDNLPPAIASDAFITRDGLHLPVRHWDAKEPKAIIVALHGMSDYSNAFAIPAPMPRELPVTSATWPSSGSMRYNLDI